MAIVQTGLTLEELLKLPEEKPALEYLDGVVTQKLAPSGPHGGLQAELAFLLKLYLRQNPIAEVYTELRSNRVRRASLVPDLSVYLLDRVPTNPDGKVADDFWVPPDLAIEIASPGQSANWPTERAVTLLVAGAQVVVLVEPRAERVRLARPNRPLVTYQGDDAVTVDDVLPGFERVVSELFARLQVRRPGGGPTR